jgi:hypothetical protein
VQEEKKDDEVEEVIPQEQELLQDFHDTTLLSFPHRNRKAKIDKQFGKFVEVIQNLYINIPLLDAIRYVPTRSISKTSSTTKDHCPPLR